MPPPAPELAEQVTEDLAALFRASLGDARVSGTVGQEMELCRQYLRIEGVRLGERLQTTVDVAELPEHALLPVLTVQPLLENAVYQRHSRRRPALHSHREHLARGLPAECKTR